MTLRSSLRKGRYVRQLQWDSTKKSPTEWANFYGAGTLGIGDTILLRDGQNFTEISSPTRGTWLGKLMRGYKLRMGIIKRREFGVTLDVVK